MTDFFEPPQQSPDCPRCGDRMSKGWTTHGLGWKVENTRNLKLLWICDSCYYEMPRERDEVDKIFMGALREERCLVCGHTEDSGRACMSPEFRPFFGDRQ